MYGRWPPRDGRPVVTSDRPGSRTRISAEDSAKIAELARRFGVSRVLLFGSASEPGGEARDIDLAVDGIDPTLFFRFYGELMCSLSKPVDLVDLSTGGRFSELVRRDGVSLYVKGA